MIAFDGNSGEAVASGPILRGLQILQRISGENITMLSLTFLCSSLSPPQQKARHVAEFAPIDPLHPHDHWMKRALDQAVAAFDADEVPVGAVVVHENDIIAAAHNQRETLNDPTAHAEMIAITQAAEALGSWRLLQCTIYVTLEPCPMCAGAIVQARLPWVIYGTADPKAGACDSLLNITGDVRLNHQAAVLGGVMQDDCRAILREFFQKQRALGKK